MDMIRDLLVQGAQMALVLLLAPLLTGFVRKAKARLLRRRGASLLQPYRDLLRLLRKEAVLADNASWLFRTRPISSSPPPGSLPRWCRHSPPI
jgi:formate hydrogenlyase subunit 4